jgi:hypothetical protein
MEESNKDYNKIFQDVPEIEAKIKDLNKELKACVSRNEAHRIIGTIHDMRWDLDTLKNEGKTDFRTQSVIDHKLQLLEGRVCVKAGKLLDKEIESKGKRSLNI